MHFSNSDTLIRIPKATHPTFAPMQTTTDTSLRNFRILAFVEGVSFLLILFVTMPLKYLYEMPGPK